MTLTYSESMRCDWSDAFDTSDAVDSFEDTIMDDDAGYVVTVDLIVWGV